MVMAESPWDTHGMLFSSLFLFFLCFTGKGKLVWLFCFTGKLLTGGWDFLVWFFFFNVQRTFALDKHLF